ncbi:hypothetical protein GCM10022393_36940 [Aquimarina addita]|uniref:Knr4/Smi1-like domain-containing protein n=1 Tax=Aquimarina addita TaxID=870485 RepID=A0ABP6US57_9FLAO
MPKSIEQFKKELFQESDGNTFSKLKEKLIKTYGSSNREEVITILIEYCKNGQLLHWRNFLLSDVLKLVQANEYKYASFFEWTITQSSLIYWGIDGLLKTKGEKAYDTLIHVLTDENIALASRAKAIKSISVYSKQTFDKALPEDPGYWKANDFRIDEILTWQNNGYLNGKGYEKPTVHASLRNPKTSFEKIVAVLDQTLEKQRSNHQDASNPSDWMVIADKEKIAEIEKHWKLPDEYLLFLKNYSPLKVFIKNNTFPQGLSLYGAQNLLKKQHGYAYNPVKKEVLANWPAHLVVIADTDTDPYCIDINDSKGTIYTSMYGTGSWEFDVFSDSFEDFLKVITT